MNKKNENRIKEMLAELSDIAKKEKTILSIYVRDDYVSVNNDYWVKPKNKKISLTSLDRGKSWTGL